MQYSWVPEDRSEITQFVGAGVQWTGPIQGRDEDVLGTAVYYSKVSEEAGFRLNSETAVEVYYKIQVCPNLTVKPDLQYIANPGADSSKDSLAVGMRIEMSY
jgi:porin